MNSYLTQIADDLEAVAGASTTANASLTGYWKRIAAAAEVIAGASTSANADLDGYILRTALALESVEGTSPTGYGLNTNGLLARVANALEHNAGASNGSLIKRIAEAAAGYTGGSSLTLDFTTGTLPAGVTVTRASANATYFDNAGQMQTVSGNDTARFNYVGGVPCLLLEPARTNLFTRSAEFDHADWNKARTTITANATTAPDGTVAADALTATTDDGNHYTYQNLTFSAGPYAASIFAKPNGYSWPVSSTWDGAAEHRAWFDVTNGVTGAQTNSTAAMLQLSSGWWRCVSLITVAGSGSGDGGLKVSDANSNEFFAGDGTSGIYAWGVQLEAGAQATSYIPTTNATATRALETLNFTMPAGKTTATVVYRDLTTQDFTRSPGPATITGAELTGSSTGFELDHLEFS